MNMNPRFCFIAKLLRRFFHKNDSTAHLKIELANKTSQRILLPQELRERMALSFITSNSRTRSERDPSMSITTLSMLTLCCVYATSLHDVTRTWNQACLINASSTNICGITTVNGPRQKATHASFSILVLEFAFID